MCGRFIFVVRVLVLAIVLGGCGTLFDLDPPTMRPDAGAEVDAGPIEQPVDAAVTAACPQPPPGCTLFTCAGTASCYYSCASPVKWRSAEESCAQIGCLATIESKLEQECIVAATNPTNANPLWIGANQPDSGGEPLNGWGWSCGNSTYSNWAAYEPNDLYGNQDCAELIAGGMWNDDACDADRRFLCELPQ